MRTLLLLFLFTGNAFAAEPSPRLIELAKERQLLEVQREYARVLFENVQMKLEKLEAEVKQLTEKNKPEEGQKP